MKARLNGTKDPFVEITEVSLANKPYVVYPADRIEFEQQQEPTSDHWQDVRERAAIAAMHAFCVSPSSGAKNITLNQMVKHLVKVADALVKELKGE